MTEVWNLDPIYRGFDDPAFEADLTALKQQVGGFTAFVQTLGDCVPAQGLREGIAYEEKIYELANKLAEYAMLRQSADARDSEAGSQLGRVTMATLGLLPGSQLLGSEGIQL